ncbi:MAG: glutathione S-transferase N-terminal domain-containing protein [Sphingomonas sp.]|jgi:glutathione S-transferase
MTNSYRLFGMPGSLYTAKARAYLRKQQLDMVEMPVGDPAFQPILKQIGRFIMPVVVMPGGEVVQDSTAIIDHIEAIGAARRSAYPQTPVHHLVSLIIELFGGEGLLRPAMHYRWNFDAENIAFLRHDFVAALNPKADKVTGDATFAMASTLMRKAGASFGVNEATIPTIESSYAELLALLDAHFSTTPYLLGGRPTIGDYGLIGPLFAHLGRDPAPARQMQAGARAVFRWTERMNAPDALLDGLCRDEALFADDAVPDTLMALLRYIAVDYLPELTAHIAFTNAWLAERPDLAPGTNGLENPAQRSIGMASFVWRGHEIATAVLPYRFWLLQRVQDAAAALDSKGKAAIAALLEDCGLAPLLELRTARRVERVNHLEIWGDAELANA